MSIFRTGLALLLALAPQLVLAERLALVLGIDQYQHVPPLQNAVNDARLIARSLDKLNFKVTLLQNAGRADVLQSFGRLASTAAPGDVVFVYYAGHAVQFAGENYIIPSDAEIEKPEDLRQKAISFTALFDSFDRSGKTVNVFAFDSCRDNPFQNAFAQARARNLKVVRDDKGVDHKIDYSAQGLVQPQKLPDNTLVAYSTEPGSVALDGEGGNSPFATALARELLVEGIEVASVFRKVGLAVKDVTRFNQKPWVNLSLNQSLVLNPQKRAGFSPF